MVYLLLCSDRFVIMEDVLELVFFVIVTSSPRLNVLLSL